MPVQPGTLRPYDRRRSSSLDSTRASGTIFVRKPFQAFGELRSPVFLQKQLESHHLLLHGQLQFADRQCDLRVLVEEIEKPPLVFGVVVALEVHPFRFQHGETQDAVPDVLQADEEIGIDAARCQPCK